MRERSRPTVTGNTRNKCLTVIFNSLIKVLEEAKDEEVPAALNEALRALLGSIEDPEGLNMLMLLLHGWYAHLVLKSCSFPTCDAQDKKRCTAALGERLRPVLHLLRGVRA